MKNPILFFLYFLCFNLNAQNKADTAVYLCKYSFEWQRDTDNIFSKTNELMYLEIGSDASTYYSYHHYKGLQNFLGDMKAKKDLDYIQNNSTRYYQNSESEIIIHNYNTKEFKVIDKLTANGITYCYFDAVVQPIWALSNDTLTILNHPTQKATTTYKGRDYIAWFATDIPLSAGPWQFTGLPGLILKIYDTKSQISFNAIEFGRSTTAHVAEFEYPNCLQVVKAKLRDLKKLQSEDRMAFEKMQHPELTFTVTNSVGEIISIPTKLKPYNPIDLTK